MDTAFRPLAGVRVEALGGPQAGTVVTSDINGFFTVVGNGFPYRATKDGYVSAEVARPATSGSPGSLIFILDVLTPPANIAGEYAMTFIADSGCTDLPKELQRRTYTATVTPDPSRQAWFALSAGGASFLPTYQTFQVGVAGNYVVFNLDFDRPGLVEQIAPQGTLVYQGAGTATVPASSPSTITASFSGVISYCAASSAQSCVAPDASGRVQCESANHQLILTRR